LARSNQVHLALQWSGGLRFLARTPVGDLVLDGDAAAGPSPVQALALALASCMGTDVVDILAKGRFTVEACEVVFDGERRPEDPRRFLAISLRFLVRGAIPPDRIERAIALSKDHYCSVWHSLNPDIAFTTSFELLGPESRGATGA
jgi:putative redox protein